MSAETVAFDHYRQRVDLADALADAAGQMWGRVDPGDIVGSWLTQMPELLVLTAASQLGAARTADAYLTDVLDAQAVDPVRDARVSSDAFAGVASDGRPLDSLLYRPAVASLLTIQGGGDVGQALAAGAATLDMIARTQVADAGRVADGVALTSRRHASGYVRMVVGKTCGRCVVLAGRRYEWNAGFDRHPRCDCVHVPASEDTADDVRTDPRKFFSSLSRAEQDKAFTVAGAKAIRDGADIGQVVNARRGALGLTPAGARITEAEARALRGGRDRGQLQTQNVFGRELHTTTEAVTTRGRAGVLLGAKETGQKAGGRYRSAKGVRLMPESIYQIADGDRSEALRLLKRFGYIL